MALDIAGVLSIDVLGALGVVKAKCSVSNVAVSE